MPAGSGTICSCNTHSYPYLQSLQLTVESLPFSIQVLVVALAAVPGKEPFLWNPYIRCFHRLPGKDLLTSLAQEIPAVEVGLLSWGLQKQQVQLSKIHTSSGRWHLLY